MLQPPVLLVDGAMPWVASHSVCLHYLHLMMVQIASLEPLRGRCEAAEGARDRATAELARVSGMMANLEARLQQVRGLAPAARRT
jgi:hypothetical protein